MTDKPKFDPSRVSISTSHNAGKHVRACAFIGPDGATHFVEEEFITIDDIGAFDEALVEQARAQFDRMLAAQPET